MSALTLTRTASSPLGTSGRMDLPTGERLYSIEQPWRNDEQGQSCVPPGTYALIPYRSPSKGPTWYLENKDLSVGGAGAYRSYCELHASNWSRELEGCIAFGLDGQPMLDPVTGQVEPAVEHSDDAISVLHQVLGPMTTGHTLTIEYAPGVSPATSP